MKIGHKTKCVNSAFGHLVRLVADSLTAETQASSSDRPLADGSEFIGDYNFRTGRPDSGNDPTGWYEDDF